MNCIKCNDTGKIGNSLFLDCSCPVATTRALLDGQVGAMRICGDAEDDIAWQIYQMGAASKPWITLSDLEWMNIVNHDHAFESMDKTEAVHLAVKMTEAKLKEINHDPDRADDLRAQRDLARAQLASKPDIDLEAIAWAYQKLLAFGVENSSPSNALLMDRLNLMLLQA